MPGKLYLVATPIGNLEDITLRALECLRNADVIACEDTRHSRILLEHYGINARTVSYHEHNKFDKAYALAAELKAGKNIALVTDAGTPGISDPGEELVKVCMEQGIEVTSLPGASAVITALSMCGLPSRRFVFEGFLPSEKKDRQKALGRLVNETRTIVIYEAPHHLRKTLKDLQDTLAEREIRICREITKIHETVMSCTISEAIRFFETEEPRGEMVIVISGADEEELARKEIESFQELSVEEHMDRYLAEGMSEKDAMKAVASDRGISKREVYSMLKIDSKQEEL